MPIEAKCSNFSIMDTQHYDRILGQNSRITIYGVEVPTVLNCLHTIFIMYFQTSKFCVLFSEELSYSKLTLECVALLHKMQNLRRN